MAEFTEVTKQHRRMCDYYDGSCESRNCPLKGNMICRNVIYKVCEEEIKEAEEIIIQWAKEHPAMTNADKLKEVFGQLVFECIYEQDSDKEWWSREYKKPKGE